MMQPLLTPIQEENASCSSMSLSTNPTKTNGYDCPTWSPHDLNDRLNTLLAIESGGGGNNSRDDALLFEFQAAEINVGESALTPHPKSSKIKPLIVYSIIFGLFLAFIVVLICIANE